jgi:inorganic triphosphatase YgiF
MSPHEVELKFTIDAPTLRRLRRSSALKALTVGAVKTRRLVSTYYDTPDGRLREAGITWRLRRQGREIVQTIKVAGAQGTLARGEFESALRGRKPDPLQIPDPVLSQEVAECLNGAVLEPLALTDVRRTERRLVTPERDIFDVLLDEANLSAAGETGTLLELELEHLAGRREKLFEIARELAVLYPIELSLVSKAERALALAKPKAAFKAPWIHLEPQASAADALTIVLTQGLRHITLHTALAREAQEPEAIHQIRVGLRRLRAALTAYARSFGAERLKLMADQCRDFANELSAARDLDVFAVEIVTPAREAISNRDVLDAISTELAARRTASWARAQSALVAPAYRLFLLDLAEIALCGFTAGEGKPHPSGVAARALAGDLLDHRFAKARSLAERFEELTTDERHDLRKELKKLRYPSELFASLFDKGVKKYFASLAKLQDDLGHLNDVATARGLLHELVIAISARDAGRGLEAAYVAGEITGWHAHRVEKSLKRVMKHWQRFAASEPFWRR